MLSGVATATFTAEILISYLNKKLNEVSEKLDRLEELVKEK